MNYGEIRALYPSRLIGHVNVAICLLVGYAVEDDHPVRQKLAAGLFLPSKRDNRGWSGHSLSEPYIGTLIDAFVHDPQEHLTPGLQAAS